MAPVRPPSAAAQRRRSTLHPAAIAAGVALLATLGYHSLASSPRSTASPGATTSSDGSSQRALGEAGGEVTDDLSVFDAGHPAVVNLDPALLRALRGAATEAAGDGVELEVNSGWRSQAYQQQLLQEAVSRYGSEAEASRWVAPPDRSAHVSGDAVDVGGPGATAWLSVRGAAYGLCPVYDNEPWHFERRADARTNGCPPRYADPTQDPRMQ